MYINFANTLANTLISIAFFIIGIFVLPIITNKLLRAKYKCMDKCWYMRLEESMSAKQGEGKQRASKTREDAWLKNQVCACKSGKLNKTRVQALYECGAISTTEGMLNIESKKQEMINFTFSPNVIQRICCGLSCTCMTLVPLFCNYEPAVSFISGTIGATLTIICVCDLRARIIPWQLCALYALIAVVWILANKELSNIPLNLYIALGCALGIYVLERIARRLTGVSAIGAGDRRLIPIIAFQVGAQGLIPGLLAMSVAGLAMALYAIAHGKGRRSYLPFAPPLYAWVIAGSAAYILSNSVFPALPILF